MASAASDHEQIRNVIALYNQALDEKHWEWLEQVLAPDISLEYPAPLAAWKGIPDSIAGLQKAISHLSTAHCLSTQSIHLMGSKTAKAKTLCTAHHYEDGKAFVAHGRYDDELIKGTFDGVKGWRIKRRIVTVIGVPEGDWSLLH
ncbi:hypothetical protein LTS17_005393 [Exophiala oligosperma]